MPTQPAVYDAYLRVDDSPSQHNEPMALFLNRVAGEYWDQVRELIEQWVKRYPPDARRDLVGRLRSLDDRQSGAAFWELYLNEMFTRADFDVQVHPSVPSGSRVPDFLVNNSEHEFYVEAKSLFDKGLGDTSARLRVVYDAINSIKNPNFFVRVEVECEGSLAPSTRRLKLELESWLNGLDPDKVNPLTRFDKSDEQYVWELNDWKLIFRPLPVKAEARGKAGHLPLGTWGPADAYIVDAVSPLREALKDKGSSYGQLDHPLLLAFNTSTGFDQTYEMMSALYGNTAGFKVSNPNGARESQDVSGYWGYPSAWRHRHVAGVLLGLNLSPWNLTKTNPTLWLHPSPFASIPVIDAWHQMRLEVDDVNKHFAISGMHELFSVGADWPRGKPFPRH